METHSSQSFFSAASPLFSRGFSAGRSIVEAGCNNGLGALVANVIFRSTLNVKGFVLLGVINKSIIETSKVVYDLSIYILGKMPPAGAPSEKGVSCFLKEKCWSVIGGIQQFLDFLDACYSNYFHIRTQSQILRECPSEELFYTSSQSPSAMEKARFAVIKYMQEVFLSQNCGTLSGYLVEKMGYALPIKSALTLKLMPIIVAAGIYIEYVKIEGETQQRLEARENLFAELPNYTIEEETQQILKARVNLFKELPNYIKQ